VSETLVATGLACIIAAIVGGGLKAAGNEFPPIASLRRQVLLGALGLVLVPLGLTAPWDDDDPAPDGPTATKPGEPTPRPAPAPSTKPVVVELYSGGTKLPQRGFFTPSGDVISTSEAVGHEQLSVHWRHEGETVRAPARIVESKARLILIQLTSGGPRPKVPFDVGRAATLRKGDTIEAYFSPSEHPQGDVRRIGASGDFQDPNGKFHHVRHLIVTSPVGDQGDSGSPVLDAEGRLVGVFYGGRFKHGDVPIESYSIAIDAVRQQFHAAF
jgi:hypothetical protein